MSEAKVRIRVAHNAMHLPVVALRGLVVFPMCRRTRTPRTAS